VQRRRYDAVEMEPAEVSAARKLLSRGAIVDAADKNVDQRPKPICTGRDRHACISR
jgi:hypothetical protein